MRSSFCILLKLYNDLRQAVPALVALESSTVSAISQIAYREHKVVHSKHETIVERGYLDGIRACFIYQRNVIGDGAGATLNPFTAKLRPLYDVVKEGTRKVKKKLLDTIVSSVDFDPVKLNVEEPPTHLEYTRFIIGNLIFLDYATTDELFQMITTMEKLVAGTGVMVAHSIETEIFKNQNEHENVDKIVNADRLKVLASGAAILMMLWMARTYLRKAYGVNDQKVREYRAGKLKLNDPVMNKVPGRNPNVNMAAIWEQIEETAKGLENSTDMMEQCRQLVELLNVDNELKLVADGGQDNDLEFGSGDIGNTPDVSADEASLPQTPKRKRKSGAGLEKSTSKRRKPQSSKKRRKD
jgi:cohesin loading factor subunit SCC2